MSEIYTQAGVNIHLGDEASSLAAKRAKTTLSVRSGLLGSAVDLPGGFSGILDMGDWYMVQNCDGVGTKMALAEMNQAFSEMGKDLLAMVSDDAVCVGAEPVSLVNTFDVSQIDPQKIDVLMQSLADACIQQKIIISGGEIAELKGMVSGITWNATIMGILEKSKYLSGKEVVPGDHIMALEEKGFRSNGFSLVRKILQEHKKEISDLAKKCLRGSTIYADAVLSVIGRFHQERKAEVHGLVHITGGGIPGNIFRVLPSGMGAVFNDLFPPGPEMVLLQEMGKIPLRDFFEVWNAGNGMLMIAPPNESENIMNLLREKGIASRIAGRVTTEKSLEIHSWKGDILQWKRQR